MVELGPRIVEMWLYKTNNGFSCTYHAELRSQKIIATIKYRHNRCHGDERDKPVTEVALEPSANANMALLYEMEPSQSHDETMYNVHNCVLTMSERE